MIIIGRPRLSLTRGFKINSFTVLDNAPSSGGHRYILVRCECGRELEVRLDSVASERSKSCGCKRKRTNSHNGKAGEAVKKPTGIDPRFDIGMKSGSLRCIGDAPRQSGHRCVRVRCDCGTELDVRLDNVLSGKSASCGCERGLPKEILKGKIGSSTYTIINRSSKTNLA